MARVKYEERYCAFIDILGFSSLIAGIGADGTSHNIVRELLQQVYRPVKKDNNLFRDGDFRAQSISDALAMSVARNEQGLLNLFLVLELLARQLLFQGYFLRGGIVRGMLYHDNRMVFGKALIDAYHLESKVARFPRIMIARDVVTDTFSYTLPTTFSGLIRRSNDGPYHLHILRRLSPDASNDWTPDELHSDQDVVLEPYHLMFQKIQQRLDQATDNPNHFEKVQWFARYWNDSLPEGSTKVPRVTGPGLESKPALWG